MRRCLDGQDEAFAVIVHRYEGPITRFFKKRCPGPLRVEEYVADTFEKAWEGLRRFQGESLEPWLITIAKRVGAEHFRKENVWRSRLEDYVLGLVPGAERFMLLRREEELRLDVRQAFDRLDRTDRTVVYSRIVKKKSGRTTASELGMTRYEVKERLQRALEELRRSVR